jgi:hypothetical protein
MTSCLQCKTEFKPGVYWQRFCGDECRRAFHAEETRRCRELARRERAEALGRLVDEAPERQPQEAAA